MTDASKKKSSGGDFFTDAGQADHLAEALLLGQNIWVPELGWLTWSETHWQEIHDAQVLERVKRHVRAKFRGAAQAMAASDDTKLIDGWRSMLSAKRMNAALNLTRGIEGIIVMGAELDEDRHLLNMADGTLDLRTGEVQPHDRDQHLTMVTPTGMGDKGSELWTSFLERVQPDADVRAFLKRLMGSSLIGEIREHVMPIHNGEGANGKGAFRSAILHALGPYCLEVDPAILIAGKHSRHLTFLMELRGKRLVFCSETSRDARFNEAEMKRLVGGDPIQANRMRHDPITFLPSHTLMMVTNFLPEISGDDEANWRRVLVIPWDVVIPVEERDLQLPEKLREATPAILTWLYEGWMEYQRVGLSPPDKVRLRTAKYREDNDAIAQFVGERCMRSTAATVKPRDLYEAWVRWSAKNGHIAGSEKAFTMALNKRGFEKAGRVWAGLGLYSEDDEEPGDYRLHAA